MADAVKPTVWEYVLIRYPADGSKPFILGPAVQVLASSEAQVHKLAARAIPDNMDLEEVTIAVRPF